MRGYGNWQLFYHYEIWRIKKYFIDSFRVSTFSLSLFISLNSSKKSPINTKLQQEKTVKKEKKMYACDKSNIVEILL